MVGLSRILQSDGCSLHTHCTSCLPVPRATKRFWLLRAEVVDVLRIGWMGEKLPHKAEPLRPVAVVWDVVQPAEVANSATRRVGMSKRDEAATTYDVSSEQ